MAASPLPRVDTNAPALRPWILLVDDDRNAARSLARLIDVRLQVAVCAASGTEEAVACLRSQCTHPAGLILDYELAGGETGLGVLSALRSLGIYAPCAFWTGAPDRLRMHAVNAAFTERFVICTRGTELPALFTWMTQLAELVARKGSVSFGSGLRRKVTPS